MYSKKTFRWNKKSESSVLARANIARVGERDGERERVSDLISRREREKDHIDFANDLTTIILF